MEPRVRLTAILVVLNGERLLDRCLESLSFCDRILIVDSFSTDATEEIARKHGAIFIQNKWPGQAKQVQYGLDWLEAHAPSEWVMMVDCDELISAELRQSILAALDAPGDRTSFSMPRLTWYFDGFLRHGGCYPDRLFRLFKKNGVRIDNNGAHQKFVPTGPYGELSGDMIHYTYESFSNQLVKLNDYAERGARDLEAKGKKGGVMAGLGHGLWRFVDMYFRKLGLLDGRAGFLMAAHTSFYTFLKYVRINEGGWGAPYDHCPIGDASRANSESKRG